MVKSIKLPTRLLEALKLGTVVPFVGAGASKSASPAKFPSWAQLVRSMTTYALKRGFTDRHTFNQIQSLIKQGKYLLAVEALKSYMPTDSYKDFLEQNFQYRDDDLVDLSVQSLLLAIANKLIITTNFDRLLEDAYAKTFKRAATVSTFRDPYSIQATLQQQSLSTAPVIFKIHGDIADITSLILSERDYRTILFDHQAYESVLTSIFMTHVVLFVGFSLSDKEVMLHLEKLRHRMNYFSQPNFALISDADDNSVEDSVFRQHYGIEIIRYPHDTTHTALPIVLKQLSRVRAGSKP